MVDAHSKWPEIPVIGISSTTTNKTITELYKMFVAYGLPAQLLSDNGPQFIGEQFANFMQVNGIKHISVHHSIPLQMVLLNA